MTRRELLVAGAACGFPLSAKSHWDRFRIGAITDELGKNADEAVDFAQNNGLIWAELRNVPGTSKEYWNSREADAQADAAHLVNGKIKVSCLQTSLFRFAWDDPRWERRMEDLRKALRCAQIVGADKIRIFAGLRTADPAVAQQRIADTFGEMAAEAERQKISLAVENDPATNIATSAEMAAVLKLTPSKWLGINWCPYNSRQVEQPFPDGYGLLPKKRILNVRVHARSLMPGPDMEDWKRILAALDKDGYGGRITLETGAAAGDRVTVARDAVDQLLHIVREVS